MKDWPIVILGTHKGVECRFYFDAADGNLIAMEMFPEDDADPCELYFSRYRDVGGRMLPGRIEVRNGDEVYGVFSINEITLEKTTVK